MRQLTPLIILTLLSFPLYARQAHNPANASIAGTYKGRLYCASGKCLETTLELQPATGDDGSGVFHAINKYLSSKNEDSAVTFSGRYTINKFQAAPGITCIVNAMTSISQTHSFFARFYGLNKDGNMAPLEYVHEHYQPVTAPVDLTLKRQ